MATDEDDVMAGERNQIADKISDQILDLLKDEGCKIREEAGYQEENNVTVIPFKRDGLNLLIVVDHDDVGYVQVILPNFYSLDNKEEKVKGYISANVVTSRLKCVKVYVNKAEDDVMAAIEYMESETAINKDALLRYIKAVASAGQTFGREMQV
jgi:hypothetical protein